VSLTVVSDERPFAQSYVAVRVNPTPKSSAPRQAIATPVVAGRLVTVIVPIYDDIDVTRACLESLAAQEAGDLVIRVVLVDDAAPDPAMTGLVVDMSGRHGFELIVNRRNLGFIGAVNRALERIVVGDIVLLNADVVLPPRAIAKLAAAAQVRPDIGIVNPLTNNGQFNSFPSMFGANDFPSPGRIAAIDAVAERTANGRLVETPGGIGYCMYVTRACLDAVGAIPEVYLRGYYEDVEFCLRARERGFATVCAPDIYVGHKGTVSFKDEKKRLVARNERVNEARFPLHAPSCRAFRRADPLRAIRAAVEAEAFPLLPVDVVVAGGASYLPVLRARAAGLARSGEAALILSWSALNGTLAAQMQRYGDAEPRQAVYPLDAGGALVDLVETVLTLAPRRIELAGAPGLFSATLDMLRLRGLGFGALLCESNGRSTTLAQPCPSPDEADPCMACVDHFDRDWMPQGVGGPLYRSLTANEPPPALFVPMDDMAQELATDLESDGFATSRFERFSPSSDVARAAEPPQAGRAVLALPYPEPDIATERFVGALAAAARRYGMEWTFVLLGRGLDDRRAMSTGNVFVTGPMSDSDYGAALVHYGATALLAPQRWSGFGLLADLAAAHDLPKAFFDWSIGAVPGQGADLSIDPRVCDAKAAGTICRWLDGLAARVPS
jgi:GT2 family glycosyltransferase